MGKVSLVKKEEDVTMTFTYMTSNNNIGGKEGNS